MCTKYLRYYHWFSCEFKYQMFYKCKVIDNSVFIFKFETGFYNCNWDFRQMLKKLFGKERNNLAIYFDSFEIKYVHGIKS